MKDNKWPVIHSGFSGGAKKAALMSADLMTTGANVVGCFMSGVNEEYFVNGLNRVTKKSAAKRQYRRMAVFLCSGSTDEVATPAQHQSVEKKVKSAGIKATKIHTFEGGHNANWGVLPEAIEWILANCKDEFK